MLKVFNQHKRINTMAQEQDRNGQLYGKVLSTGAVALGLLAVFLFTKSISEIQGWRLIGKDIAPQATVSVSGKGEMVVKPDIVTFSFGVEEESLVVGDAQAAVAKTENAILDFLKKNGVAKDDIKVSGYNIYPRYDYEYNGRTYDGRVSLPLPGGGKRILAAYVVSEYVEVKLRNLSDAGKLIGGLGELGATNVSGLTFGVDKEEEVLKEAREKAIADAKEKAKRLARDLGVSLVRIVSYSDGGGYPGPYYAKMEMATGAARDSVSPELPSGTNKIVSQVSITYEIR